MRGTNKDSHKDTARYWWMTGTVFFCLLVVAGIVAGALVFWEDPASDSEYTQDRLLEETHGVAHDELIMLIISLAVVVQIATNFKFLKPLPRRSLILCSFCLMALSVCCTVAEGFFLPEPLNYAEHLLFLTSAILLAAWCWCVFGSTKQEGS